MNDKTQKQIGVKYVFIYILYHFCKIFVLLNGLTFYLTTPESRQYVCTGAAVIGSSFPLLLNTLPLTLKFWTISTKSVFSCLFTLIYLSNKAESRQYVCTEALQLAQVFHFFLNILRKHSNTVL